MSRWPRLSQRQTIVLGVGLLSLGMSVWQLTVPEFLSSYDTGVYLAASMHLVSGVMPYRDFSFVQPPGVLLLMSPVAVFSRFFGSHDGFVVARVASAMVVALNSSLLAWLVRHRGRLAMLIAGIGLVFIPVASFVSSSLTLEPYCICFILGGSVVIFSDEQWRGRFSTRTLAIGGLLFGLAAVVKLWAFLPFVAMVICLAPRFRRRVFIFIGAAACGFVVPSLPFFLAAPRNFVSQVLVEQLFRNANSYSGAGILHRLTVLTGFSPTTIAPTGLEALIGFISLLLIVALALRRWKECEALDFFFLLSAGFTVSALLATSEFFPHYGYFSAPFLLGLFGIALARLSAPLGRLVHHLSVSRAIRQSVSWLSAITATLFVFALVLYCTSFYSVYSWANGLYEPAFSAITNRVPVGACVVYTEVSYGVVANRWPSNNPKCPIMVDPYGMWLAWGDHLIAPAPAFVDEWKSYFEKAQFAVLSNPGDAIVPWTPSLAAWFTSHYHLVFGKNYIFIYQHE